MKSLTGWSRRAWLSAAWSGLLILPGLRAADPRPGEYGHHENVTLSAAGAAPGDDGRFFQQYSLAVKAGDEVRVAISGQPGDPANPAASLIDNVRLFLDQGDGRWQPADSLQAALAPRQDARLRFLLTTQRPGQTARVHLDFSLRAAAEPARLVRHEIYGGTLTPDQLALYAVHPANGQETLRIRLESPDFDPKLAVGTMDAVGIFNARERDDDSGGGTTAQLDYLPGQPGDFIVAVSSIVTLTGGRYRLMIDTQLRLVPAMGETAHTPAAAN